MTGPPSTSAWAVIWSGAVEKYLGTKYHSITVLVMDFSETSLRHEYIMISSKREGGIEICHFFSCHYLARREGVN